MTAESNIPSFTISNETDSETIIDIDFTDDQGVPVSPHFRAELASQSETVTEPHESSLPFVTKLNIYASVDDQSTFFVTTAWPCESISFSGQAGIYDVQILPETKNS